MIGARALPLACLAAAGGLSGAGAGAAAAGPASSIPRAGQCCALVELRQYTLHPRRFDAFAQMFENEFLDPLEAAGMTVIGQFRDLDDANRFVWLRGFADMPSRATSLAAFYDGPVWKARRDAANANFTDTDNVLLLHPVTPATGLRLPARLPAQRAARERGVVLAAVYSLAPDAAVAFPAWFGAELQPVLAAAGISVDATFETESSANNFPRLPVREGEHVFAWFARFPDMAAYARYREALIGAPGWRALAVSLARRLQGPPQVLRLAPCSRSRLR